MSINSTSNSSSTNSTSSTHNDSSTHNNPSQPSQGNLNGLSVKASTPPADSPIKQAQATAQKSSNPIGNFFNNVKNDVVNVANSVKNGVETVGNDIKNGVETAANGIKNGVETAVTDVKNIASGIGHAITLDGGPAHNGEVYSTNPNNAATPTSGQPVIAINGVNTDLAGGKSFGQFVANQTGQSTNLIYNGTPIPEVALGGLAGSLIPGLNPLSATKYVGLTNPVAANAASDQIINQLKQSPTDPVKIVAYSQGAAISMAALRETQVKLTAQYGAQQANQMLSRVNVLTLGGAAARKDFPASVHVTEIYHKTDPVPEAFGDNNPIAGGGIDFTLKQHLNYPNDPKALQLIDQWKNGQLNDQRIALPDYNG